MSYCHSRTPLHVLVLLTWSALASSPAAAQSLSVFSGNGQIVMEEFRSTSPLVVIARDAAGNPVEGVSVDFAVTEGGGGLSNPEGVTDSSGLTSTYYVATSFDTAQSIKTVRVTASSSSGSTEFILTASRIRFPGGAPAPPPAVVMLEPSVVAPPLEGEAGTTMPAAIRALVTVQSGLQVGEPVPNVGMRIVDADNILDPVPLACDGLNGMVFSGPDGLVECDLVLGMQPGSYRIAAYVGEAAFSYLIRVNITGDVPGGGGGGEPEPDPLTITTSSSLPPAQIGGAYAITFSATGGQAPYTWSVTGSLPGGLSLNGGSGVLSGTPTASGTAQFTVSVTDSADVTVSRNFLLAVNDPQLPPGSFVISSSSFPNGVVGEVYSAAVLAEGGCISPFNPPIFSIAAGGLPPGLDLVAGVIRGTPTQAGTFQFTLSARDACGAQAQRIFLVTVTTTGGEPLPPAISASPGSLTFDAVAGSGSTPPAQTVLLTTDGDSTSFTAAAATFTGGEWLQVSPAAGEAPGSLQVSAGNTASLEPGAYQGEITVVPAGSAGPTRIAVTLVVTAGPELQVSPGSLHFVVRQGAPPPTQQTITISSRTPGQLYQLVVETDSGGQWLFATPAGHATPDNVFIAVSPYFMDPGSYSGTVTVRLGAEEESISVVLEIEQPQPVITAVVNAASFLEGPVAPGELVVIYGRNLGPSDLETLEVDGSGKLTRQLSGVSVSFGQFTAPVVYVSARQVAVIVPQTVTGRETTKMQLKYLEETSQEVELAVVSASPGIFTLDAAGQGAILNQDGSVNSRENAAPAGSIVSIYSTGAGELIPPADDGLVIPLTIDPLPVPTLPVEVEIGGVKATVHYAGAAPGLPNGVVQINAEIPPDLEPGVHDVIFRTGEYASPSGVTVAVK